MTANTTAYKLAPARDPAASVFVSANAGAGKTSLLTERVLCLLLHGAHPSKILCLTYTNAAAAEMMERVQGHLGSWVMADEKSLRETLGLLLGSSPDDATLERARSLFARVLEAPEGLRIQTIHGFCQSLLRRFPIEAGVSPHFSVVDARTAETLLQEARQRLFIRAQTQDAELQAGLTAIARSVSETSFQKLMAEIVRHKRRFNQLFATQDTVKETIKRVWKELGVAQGMTLEALVKKHFVYDKDRLAQLLRLPAMLLMGEGASDKKTGQGLADWLDIFPPSAERVAHYVDIFMTQKGTKRKPLFTKGTLTEPELIDALLQEQERVAQFCEAWRALRTAEYTTHMLHVADGLLVLYDTLKRNRAMMDYDDLILSACALLKKPGIAPWVLYKLDGGIDHVLVDEAQDTSPEQWIIIDALTQEFFSGEGRKHQDRTLFVVGDEKQSIYSFQGADPLALGRWQKYFYRRIQDAAKPVDKLALLHSFRSTPEILEAVDAIFARPEARAGLMFEDGALSHIPTRLKHPGLVEIWPLAEATETADALTVLVRRIADTIEGWLKEGVMLEAKGRPVQAGDIMILVGRRTTLVDKLVRALKRRQVPVAGHDRMALGENLAVQDLIALGQVLLLPEDDLTLAALLKSPIFDISEELLFELAWNRKEHLWERLQAHTAPQCRQAFALLSDLRGRADLVSPYELYSYLLDTEGARRRFTGRMGAEYHDPIDEFLGQALLYERSHPPSLQGFMHWLSASESEIKRDMEQSQNAVRILTVHGAKGLQSPIVILPDTSRLPDSKDRLLWREVEDGSLPLWTVSSDDDDALCACLRDGQKDAQHAEYRRLMYVALTRAADRLYICGAKGKNTLSEGCWYDLITRGLEGRMKPFDTPWGEGLRLGSALYCHPERSVAESKDLSLSSQQKILRCAQDDSFAFLIRPAPDEPVPPQPLAPSRLMGEEPAAASPLMENTLYQRGNLIHRLLQYLPDMPSEKRGEAAIRIALSIDANMEISLRNECIGEVLKVIGDSEFAFCFGPGTLAEVPVAGCVEVSGRTVAVSGQIDRLAVRDDEVWVIDYKSNRAPPAGSGDIPPSYLGQMRLYQLLMQQIYPGKTVRCALLWTAAPKISVLDAARLDEVPASTYI
jgi:ATP-dependent helicase/nuclease subunit A